MGKDNAMSSPIIFLTPCIFPPAQIFEKLNVRGVHSKLKKYLSDTETSTDSAGSSKTQFILM